MTRKGELDTPVPVVDLAVMEANLRRMAEVCRRNGVKLRPHTKTHKIPALARRQVELGAAGITVAKLGEAEVMADAGLDDILIAYPMVGPQKLERLFRLARRARIACTLDSVEVAQELSAAACRRGAAIRFLVEVDIGLGRCGLPPGDELMQLCARAASLPGLEFGGLLTHAGHSRRVRAPSEVEEIGRREGELMAGAARSLRVAGLEVAEVSVGSTPTAATAGAVPGVTEVRPGTYIFNDASTAALGLPGLTDVALTVLSTVVGHPAPDRLILDAGSKALSSDRLSANLLQGHGWIKGYPGLSIPSLSEEHAIVAVPPGASAPRIGEKVEIVPNHVCAVVNLFDELVGVEGDRVEVVWPVAARGKVR